MEHKRGGARPLPWEKTAARLRRDVLSGAIAPGTLLDRRTVRARYHCTPQDAAKAMRHLARQEVLHAPGYDPWYAGTTSPVAGARLGQTLAEMRRLTGQTPGQLAWAARVQALRVTEAEAGTWQPRKTWERLDEALGSGGSLLRLYDIAYAPHPGGTGNDEGPGGHQGPGTASDGPPPASRDYSERPYAWVTTAIRARVAAGEWSPGSKLPFLSDLASDHDTSAAGARVALLDLAAEGVVIHRHGDGYYMPGQPAPATRAVTKVIICYSDGTKDHIPYPSPAMTR